LAAGDAETASAVITGSLRGVSTMPVLAMTTLAEAQLASGHPEAATATAAVLAAMGPGAPYPGAVAAWIQGRAVGLPELVRRGADELAALGFVYEAAVARLDLAELSGDATLNECVRTFERLGAQPQLDRARKLLRAHGRPATPPRPGPGALSAREEQVARLVADGLSNAEIADRLYLSTRTVTTHLQNIYRRLGVGSRTALTRYVLRDLPPNT
jgi:DNA-binding CsgD family transcriptional regulator